MWVGCVGKNVLCAWFGRARWGLAAGVRAGNFFLQDRRAQAHRVYAQYAGELQHGGDLLRRGAQRQGLADMAAHARRIHVGAGGVDRYRDEFNRQGVEQALGHGRQTHDHEFLGPVRIQFVERGPVRVPVARGL